MANLKCGIVGLPNVGKSTLFNALSEASKAEAANYPFCTIEPNTAIVNVPDARLYKLAKIAGSKQIIPANVEFVDIAGLVKGASKGEGLGNKFLANIREVSLIIHVLRCFDDPNITHVNGSVDPISDAETIETELILADLESCERQLTSSQKKLKSGDKSLKDKVAVLERAVALLSAGEPAKPLLKEFEPEIVGSLQLLSTKPVLYVCNVDEEEAIGGNHLSKKVQKYATSQGASCLVISAKIESEIAAIESSEEKQEFIQELGLDATGLEQIIKSSYKLLQYNSFFTVGPKEAHAWTFKEGALAPNAAGIIHTDFERGFIRAEVIGAEDYISIGSEVKAKELGKIRTEGKEYTMQDGDVVHFRFNV